MSQGAQADHGNLPYTAAGPDFCLLHDYGLLKVSGADAASFLQGQATCDIHALLPGAAGCGAFCTPKGRVIANFRIARADDAFYLWLAAELVEPVRQRLRMYVLRSRVVIEDLTPQFALIGLSGAGVEAAFAECNLEIPVGATEWRCESGYAVMRLHDDSGRMLAAVDHDERPELLECLTNRLTRVNPDVWRIRDIKAGWPLVVPATSEAFLPQMLNLDLLDGVSFNKGCYTGQEIVTRTRFLGQLKRRLFRLRCLADSVPAPGDPVYDASSPELSQVGQMVNACRDGMGDIQCLAVLALDHTENLKDYKVCESDSQA